MRLWPRTLLYRLILLILAGLLLANSLTLALLLYERMSSARSVMLNNLSYDVATSVAILDRLPASERAAWLPRLARGNYRYLLSAGESGPQLDNWRSRSIVTSLHQALGNEYALNMSAISGPRDHIQAHLRLSDGSPLTIDIYPQLPALARWLPVVVILQPLLLLLCAWQAVRQVVRPLSRFTYAIERLEPAAAEAAAMDEQGPLEVRHAARAFNHMQARIQHYLKERTQILAAISHDLQTPITRMKLRLEMIRDVSLRDKLLQDLDNMTALAREGIAYARSSEPLQEPGYSLDINAFLDSIACDYIDTGRPVVFHRADDIPPLESRPQALRRIVTNLLDNALKYGGQAELIAVRRDKEWLDISVLDNGPGIPEEQQQAVLEPFYRIENSRNRNTGGTGLGLAIAAQLSAQLQGRLTLANSPQGGLTATLSLPLN
ncbi:two-component sensor histidine kinase [Salmonella enterica subsp. enterica serovar Choleraesuis]|nr:two-component sensor histidine kinase [Salmonella enterica subsp. enterica serovar Choleraesuis]